MPSRLQVGLVACSLAVTSAMADDFSLVNSTPSRTVSKTVSNFDAWSPSAARHQLVFDARSSSIWQRMEFVTYRITELEVKGLRLLSEPAVWEPSALNSASTFTWKAFSLENMYQVWVSEEFPLAVAVSIQPHTDQNVQVAETLVLSRSYEFWTWAVNFSQGTEWSNKIKERDGALELAWELSRRISQHWTVGIQIRDHSDLPEYRRIASNKLMCGPMVRCNADRWWAALSVMPKMFDYSFVANGDMTTQNANFEGNQKLSTRLMFGLCF
jgi:hypothetical protein